MTTTSKDFDLGLEHLTEAAKFLGTIDGGSPDLVYVYSEPQAPDFFSVVTEAEIEKLGRAYRAADADGNRSGVYSEWCASTGRDATAAEVLEARGVPTTQIAALSAEAATAGDLAMVAICERAMGSDGEALAQCARVIAATQAQAE